MQNHSCIDSASAPNGATTAVPLPFHSYWSSRWGLKLEQGAGQPALSGPTANIPTWHSTSRGTTTPLSHHTWSSRQGLNKSAGPADQAARCPSYVGLAAARQRPDVSPDMNSLTETASQPDDSTSCGATIAEPLHINHYRSSRQGLKLPRLLSHLSIMLGLCLPVGRYLLNNDTRRGDMAPIRLNRKAGDARA